MLEAESEKALAMHIAQFPEAVEAMMEDLAPNRLCAYAYELAAAFSSFYAECKVVGAPEEASRVQLVAATGVVMRKCFHILGLTPLDRI